MNKEEAYVFVGYIKAADQYGLLLDDDGNPVTILQQEDEEKYKADNAYLFEGVDVRCVLLTKDYFDSMKNENGDVNIVELAEDLWKKNEPSP